MNINQKPQLQPQTKAPMNVNLSGIGTKRPLNSNGEPDPQRPKTYNVKGVTNNLRRMTLSNTENPSSMNTNVVNTNVGGSYKKKSRKSRNSSKSKKFRNSKNKRKNKKSRKSRS